MVQDKSAGYASPEAAGRQSSGSGLIVVVAAVLAVLCLLMLLLGALAVAGGMFWVIVPVSDRIEPGVERSFPAGLEASPSAVNGARKQIELAPQGAVLLHEGNEP